MSFSELYITFQLWKNTVLPRKGYFCHHMQQSSKLRLVGYNLFAEIGLHFGIGW